MVFVRPRGPRFPMLAKVIGCLVSVVTGIASYQLRGIFHAIAFVVLGLLFGYEAFAMGVQHRDVRTIERIPFLVVFGILIFISIIINTNGGL